MKKGLGLVSVSEDFGQLGFLSGALEALVLVVAELERENIKKRTSGGRIVKASRGGYSGGRAPMGYRVVDGELVINEQEAEVVRFIFAQRDAGNTLLGIVDALNQNGYKTRNGKEFLISSVQSIVNNRKTFEGFYKYGKNGKWVKGQHEPILREETE